MENAQAAEILDSSEASKMASLRLRPLKIQLNPGSSLRYTPPEDEPRSPVTPVGRAFSQPDMNVVILCIVGLAEKPEVGKMREFLRRTLVQHKRFHSIMKSRTAFQAPEWHSVEVELSRHVFEAPSEVGPPDSSVDPAEAYAAKLATAHPLDPRFPLWQAHLLVHPKGASRPASMVLRIHHSLGDGTSLMALLIAASRQSGDPKQLPTIPGEKPKTSLKPSQSLLRHWLTAFLTFLVVVWNSLVLIWRFLAMCAIIADSETPVKAKGGMENHEKALASSSEVDLGDVKAVARGVGGGATVNDVLVASLAGGLNRYFKTRETDGGNDTDDISADGIAARAQALSDRISSKLSAESLTATSETGRDGELPSSSCNPVKQQEDSEFKSEKSRASWHVPRKLRVRALSLVNIRKSPGVQELDGMMNGGSQARWGNEMGYVMLPLPVDEVEDPLDRARAVRRETAMAKKSIEAWFTAWNGIQMVKVFGVKAAVQATKRSVVQTTMSLSNVIGPGEPVTLAGIPVTTLTPTVVGTSQGLIVHFVSYNQTVKFVACSIREVVPDPEVLCGFCVDALEELLGRVSVQKQA